MTDLQVGSLVALLDLATEGDLTLVDPDREPAIGFRANPGLEQDRRALLAVIGERDQQPPVALLALRQLHQPPPLGKPRKFKI